MSSTREAEMVSDNEGRSHSSQTEWETLGLDQWEEPQILLFPSQLSLRILRTVFVFSGPQSPKFGAQPSQPCQKAQEACGGKNTGLRPKKSGLQAQPQPVG